MAEEEHALGVLSQALQGLTLQDFQEFKTKLSEVQVEGGWNIPKDLLEKATHPCVLASCMGKSYGEDAAMEVAIGLLEEMNQRDLAEELLGEKVKGRQPADISCCSLFLFPLCDPGDWWKLGKAGFSLPGALETQRSPTLVLSV